MPHSLRAKIKCLRYKRIITDKDCDRLCKALDNEDVLDKIRIKIVEKHLSVVEKNDFESGRTYGYEEILDIIDKYKAESEK
jgi:hypothetical protein